MLGTVNPVISVGRNGRFGAAALNGPLVLPGPGSTFGAYELGAEDWCLNNSAMMARASALRALFDLPQDGPLAQAMADQQRSAFAMSDRLRSVVSVQPGEPGAVAGIDAAFVPRSPWPAS